MNSNKFYEDYEKLKTVGQGAFGTATLYRRIDDGKQVVMKEVFLMDLDNSEKKSALNEVEILSNLNHPNIIKYLGSFQKEGSLIIAMEYADGGNLAQLINAKKNKNEIFTEKSILNIVSQISAAISYMHMNKILHRDLKSANIFLNMNGNVKVGDFGISKMLNTRSQAQTVVGTPYYLSPEMCEGSDYNEKSDIWAIGCILYELACLRKPFEAMTLPVLVQKITACEYSEILEIYSDELSQLVHSILQKDPSARPSAKYIHDNVIPKTVKKFDSTTTFKVGVSRERSILYKITNFGDDQEIIPEELPHKTIIDFSIGFGHYIVVTVDHCVYTWGENDFGQLGIDSGAQKRAFATIVKSLQHEKIIRLCAAGRNFSIFLNTEGFLFSCGEGQQGCLGHGNWDSVQTPTIIEALKQEKIVKMSCGDEHVVALSTDGKVFTWGSSKKGQLGQGHMQYRCSPLAIKLLNLTKIKDLFCGENETVLLTINGQILVSGFNNYRKLGVADQEKITLFTPVPIREKIKFVSIGPNHIMLLSENGVAIALGRNPESTKPQTIKLQNKITMIACGLNFTVAADSRNVLWFWGSSYKTYRNGPQKGNSVLPLTKNQHDQTMIIKDFGQSFDQYVKIPRPILAFYASQSNIKTGNVIYMGDIKIKCNNLYMLAHTTAPPPITQFTDKDINKDPMSQVGGTTAAPTTSTSLPNMV
ncbi:serine/threonine-protein kinase Nek8 [Tribolium madens]|uniref:serine/threonine-protein kinase Nek8 n=1 Tax=Tribolium madens TaxID=41895 RepID=UPI001CF73B66|nr:serine/threonine-protein kinase Nek8 [Tribolium madens]